MATCREVIERAYRMANYVALGASPTSTEIDHSLPVLQALFDEWVSGGMFGRLTDKLVDADYTALEGQRVVATDGAVITIADTYACNGTEGNDRPPYDLSLIEVWDGTTRNVWLYDRTGWTDIAALTIDGDCPLSTRGFDGLAACVATRIDGTQGFIPPSVASAAAAFRLSLSYKSGSERAPRSAVYY